MFVFLGWASSQFLLAENLNRTSFVRTAIGGLTSIACFLSADPKVRHSGRCACDSCLLLRGDLQYCGGCKGPNQREGVLGSFNLTRIARDLLRG
jgi:hypothetical protein